MAATATASETVMGRKLAAARRGAGGGARSALRALRLALARAAADEAGLALAVIGATQGRSTLDDLGGLLTGDRLHLLLDGPDGRAGGLSLDRACVTALVQQQTTGRVDDGDVPDRPFTATDAAMVAPIADALLKRAAGLAQAAADRACLEGVRYGARMEDRRALLLAMDADRFRVFDLTVDIAAGTRQGNLCLILPDLPDEAAGTDRKAGAVPGLEQGFAAIRAELTAVVGRVRLPLSKLGQMQPGDSLPMTGGRLDMTDLVAIDGQPVATGKLGQSGGMRAVRLSGGGEPDPGAPAHRAYAGSRGRTADKPDGAGPARSGRTAGKGAERGAADPAAARAPVPDPDTAEAEAFEEHLLGLNPEQAAAEITELAGLPALADMTASSAADDGPDG